MGTIATLLSSSLELHNMICLQEVLTQLTSRLASQLNDLTIQVVKEDWTITSPLAMSPSSSLFLPPPSTTPTSHNLAANPSPAPAATATTADIFATPSQSRGQPLNVQILGGGVQGVSPPSQHHVAVPMPQGQEGQFVGGLLNSEHKHHSIPHTHGYTAAIGDTQVI